MVPMFQQFWADEDGQALVEYGLLIALLALVVISVITLFGRRVSDNLYGTTNNQLPFN